MVFFFEMDHMDNDIIIKSFFGLMDIELELKNISSECVTLKQFLLFIFFMITKEQKEENEKFFFELEQKLLRFMIFVNLNYLILNVLSSLQKKNVPIMLNEDNIINLEKVFSYDNKETTNLNFIIKNNIKFLKESIYNNILILEKDKKIYYSNSDFLLSQEEFKLLEKYLKSCDKVTISNKYNIFNLCKQFYNNTILVNNIKNFKSGIYFIQLKTYLSEIILFFRIFDIICFYYKSKILSNKIYEEKKLALHAEFN